MRAALLAWALAASLAAPAAMAAEDPRFLTLDYTAGGLFHVATSPETTQTVLFAPGERVQSVIVSDPGAYLISVTGTADGITLKANGPSALAMVNVQTSQRSYQLELVADRAGRVPALVRFSYERAANPAMPRGQAAAQVAGFDWRLSGDKAVRPSRVRDDGAKTYIEWDERQALPAVFALGSTGREEIVEAYMRGGVVTIDRVYPSLVFRIDKVSAKARRIQEKKRRGT